MPQDPADLKSMPLYRDVDRIYRELVAAGLDQDREIAVSELAPFDQYHYHGTEAVDAAIESLGITSEDRVLEIGAGIGGPARHIAATTGASVVALELQPDLNETAGDLSRRCGLSEQVTHVCADVLEYDETDEVKLRTKPEENPHVRIPDRGWRKMVDGDRLAVLAPPGTYTVRLTVGEKILSADLVVLKDPGSAGSEEDIAVQMELVFDLRDMPMSRPPRARTARTPCASA